MSWRSLRRVSLLACLVAAVAPLAGCGFKPLYGRGSATGGGSVAAELPAVEISPIGDRTGQEFRNLLIDRMHPQGPAEAYAYRLDVGIKEYDVNLGLQANATSTRGQVRLVITYSLVDQRSGKLVLHETLRTSTGYDILLNQFGSVLGQTNARDRGLSEMADELTQHVALYFTKPA